jgi:transposase
VGRALQPDHANDGRLCLQLLVAASNVKRVASLLRLDWHTVNAVIKRAVERGMMRRAEEPVRYVGLDEKSFARHHNYASVLTDIGGSRVLDVVRGRSLQDAQQLLGTLTPRQRQGVRAAAVDMWPGYMSAHPEHARPSGHRSRQVPRLQVPQ